MKKIIIPTMLLLGSGMAMANTGVTVGNGTANCIYCPMSDLFDPYHKNYMLICSEDSANPQSTNPSSPAATGDEDSSGTVLHCPEPPPTI